MTAKVILPPDFNFDDLKVGDTFKLATNPLFGPRTQRVTAITVNEDGNREVTCVDDEYAKMWGDMAFERAKAWNDVL